MCNFYYIIKTDGSTKYNSNVVTAKANKQRFKKNGGYISNRSQDYTYLKISFEDFVPQTAPYYGTMSCLIVSNAGDIGVLTLCRSDTFYVNFWNIAGNTHLVYNSIKNNKDIYFSTDVSYPRAYTVYDLTGFGMSLEGVNSIPS